MKIKVSCNRVFELSVKDTEYIINTYIKPVYPDHIFCVKKSNSTESVYIFIQYEKKQKSIRLSSHPGNNNLIYHYISPNTKVQKVVNIIVNSITALHKNYLMDILNDI